MSGNDYNIILLFVFAETLLLPILACLYLAIRKERLRKQELFIEAVRNLKLVNLSRGFKRW